MRAPRFPISAAVSRGTIRGFGAMRSVTNLPEVVNWLG